MSLTTLSRFEPATAKAILAEAILARTSDLPSAMPQRFPNEVTELINEVRHSLEIKDGDNSTKSLTRITETLAGEVSRIAAGGRDLDEVLQRLGQRGRLPLGAYKLTFVDDVLKDMHEPRRSVENVIKHSDEVQHITGSGAFADSAKGLTLIMKWICTERSAFWYLIDAQRLKNTLQIAGIYRVDPEKVDLTEAHSPLDVLKRFVDVYGLPVSVKGFPGEHLFIEDIKVDDPPSEATRLVNTDSNSKVVKYLETGHHIELTRVKGAVTKELLAEKRIVAAYAIDISKYLAERPAL